MEKSKAKINIGELPVSFKAKAVAFGIISAKMKGNINLSRVAKDLCCGRATLRKYLDELVGAGVLEYKSVTNKKGQEEEKWVIC